MGKIQGLFVFNAGAGIGGGDGGNPSLTRDEADFGALFVAEDDLGVLAGFFPGGFNDVTVLEDVGVTGAEGGNVFVVVVV